VNSRSASVQSSPITPMYIEFGDLINSKSCVVVVVVVMGDTTFGYARVIVCISMTEYECVLLLTSNTVSTHVLTHNIRRMMTTNMIDDDDEMFTSTN
jgi:hypothetical protein